MTHGEIYNYINTIAPFNTQLDFDNAGFLVGDKNDKFMGGIVTLDVTDSAIDYAISKGANLIISHHPVIFEPLKSVTANGIVYKLIKNGISVISAHTNLDMAEGGINDELCNILGLQEVETILPEGEVFSARIANLESPLSADEFANYLKQRLGGVVKYVGEGEIKRVAVCSGSGGSLLYDILEHKPDAFVTADVKHNVFLDASHLGVALYDCGHFNTEAIIVKPLCKKLNARFGYFYEHHGKEIKCL